MEVLVFDSSGVAADADAGTAVIAALGDEINDLLVYYQNAAWTDVGTSASSLRAYRNYYNIDCP